MHENEQVHFDIPTYLINVGYILFYNSMVTSWSLRTKILTEKCLTGKSKVSKWLTWMIPFLGLSLLMENLWENTDLFVVRTHRALHEQQSITQQQFPREKKSFK